MTVTAIRNFSERGRGRPRRKRFRRGRARPQTRSRRRLSWPNRRPSRPRSELVRLVVGGRGETPNRPRGGARGRSPRGNGGGGDREAVERDFRDSSGQLVGRHADSRPVPRHDGCYEHAVSRVDEARVMARGQDPAGLVRDGNSRAADEAIQLSVVLRVREEVEQAPGIRRRESAQAAHQRSATRRWPDGGT